MRKRSSAMQIKTDPRRLREEEIGRNNEALVLDLALKLRSEGVYPFDPDLPPPYLTTPYSAEDGAGIDLWVPTEKGYVGIQVKSSEQYAEEFRVKHRNGRVIPIILTNRPEDILRIDLVSAVCWAMKTWFPEGEQD